MNISFHHPGYKNRTWSVPLVFSVCHCSLPHLQRWLHLNLVNNHLFVFLYISKQYKFIFADFCSFCANGIILFILFGDLLFHFVICLRFIHVDDYSCDSVMLTLVQNFHCVNKSQFISPSSCWRILEQFIVFCYYEQCCCEQFLKPGSTHVQEFP